MIALSRTFGFTNALLIMFGLLILALAVMIPILVRRNRRTRSGFGDMGRDSNT